jgi:hypothetical protein
VSILASAGTTLRQDAYDSAPPGSSVGPRVLAEKELLGAEGVAEAVDIDSRIKVQSGIVARTFAALSLPVVYSTRFLSMKEDYYVYTRCPGREFHPIGPRKDTAPPQNYRAALQSIFRKSLEGSRIRDAILNLSN